MKYLTFDMIKAQLRLDDTQAALEHDLLCDYGEAAEEAVLNLCNRTMEDIIEAYGRLPAPIRHATLMLVDEWYQHRTAVFQGQLSPVPYAIDFNVKPYMRL